MKKIYLFFFIAFSFSLAGCSKDFLKSYDKRIVGSWKITKVSNIGFGGGEDELAFKDGAFTFREDGSLTYINGGGDVFEGTWDIDKRQVNNETMRSFRLSAVDFTNQQVLGEFYDEISFRGTDHFVANIHSGFRNFATHFKK